MPSQSPPPPPKPPGVLDRLPDVPAPPLPWVYRPRRTRVVSFAVAGTLSFAFIVSAIVLPSFGSSVWSTSDSIGLVVLALVIAGAALFLGRPQVRCDEGGLTIVNLNGTRSLEWGEVVRITFRPGDPWITLDLVEGETLSAMAFQSSGGERFRDGLAQFRALVEEHTPS